MEGIVDWTVFYAGALPGGPAACLPPPPLIEKHYKTKKDTTAFMNR